MKLHLERNSQKPVMQKAEDHLSPPPGFTALESSSKPVGTNSYLCGHEHVNSVREKMHGAEWPMLMESDIEFTNSDKGTQTAFSPKHGDCQRNKCVAHVAINLILVLLRLFL